MSTGETSVAAYGFGDSFGVIVFVSSLMGAAGVGLWDTSSQDKKSKRHKLTERSFMLKKYIIQPKYTR